MYKEPSYQELKKKYDALLAEVCAYKQCLARKGMDHDESYGWSHQESTSSTITTSHAFLKQALDNLSTHVAIVDSTGRIAYVNRKWREFAAANGGEGGLLSEGADYLHVCDTACGTYSEGAAQVAQGLRDVLHTQLEEFSLEYPCPSPDEERWFVVRITPLFWFGHPQAIVTHQDVTREKMVEHRLRSKRNELLGVLEALQDGLCMINSDYSIEYHNGSLRELVGEVQGDLCYQVFFQRESPCESCYLKKMSRSERMPRMELTLRSGRKCQLSYSQFRDLDSQEKLIVLFRDRTEEIDSKTEALRASQLAALGELAAGVAHEINNPLNVIINYAQILMDSIPEGGMAKDLLSTIISDGERIEKIATKLLSFAREPNAVSGPADIRHTLAGILGLMDGQFRKDGIHLEVDVPTTLPRVDVRESEIQQVLLNLLSHARQALNDTCSSTSRHKVLKIQAYSIQDGEYVRILFWDFGPGNLHQGVEDVTDPEVCSWPGNMGTGFGLGFIRSIIHKYRGQFTLESLPGQCTKAIVDLPADKDWDTNE